MSDTPLRDGPCPAAAALRGHERPLERFVLGTAVLLGAGVFACPAAARPSHLTPGLLPAAALWAPSGSPPRPDVAGRSVGCVAPLCREAPAPGLGGSGESLEER